MKRRRKGREKRETASRTWGVGETAGKISSSAVVGDPPFWFNPPSPIIHWPSALLLDRSFSDPKFNPGVLVRGAIRHIFRVEISCDPPRAPPALGSREEEGHVTCDLCLSTSLVPERAQSGVGLRGWKLWLSFKRISKSIWIEGWGSRNWKGVVRGINDFSVDEFQPTCVIASSHDWNAAQCTCSLLQ